MSSQFFRHFFFLHSSISTFSVLKSQRFQLLSLSSLFFFPVTLLLPLPLWQNTSALISWVSKCCSHSLLFWTPLQPFPSTSGQSTRKKHSGGGRKLEALKMNAASFYSTEWVPLWLQNGTSLSGLFHSEAEGGSQKTNTEGGGGGGAELLGLHILLPRERLGMWGWILRPSLLPQTV